jgi:hypothetical protein
MSYLAALRLHFAGRFQAAPSTVNNIAQNFDSATFEKAFQQPGNSRALWNPRGNADFRLIGCAVTSAWHADGSAAAGDDPVLEMLVADSDRQVAGKLVDLDPEQQLVSGIWGLEMRICDRHGTTLVRGAFAPASFIDLWRRAQGRGTGTDFPMSAAYQSVLTDLGWGDVGASPLLAELRGAAVDGLLSVRFDVDGYNATPGTPDFTLGRVAGTIGVARAREPRHFVAGRQFMPTAGPLNDATAVVDEPGARILIDLGNALPTTEPGGSQANLGELTLGYLAGGDANVTPIGTIDYLAGGWYERTAGVVVVPVNARQLAAITEARLALTCAKAAQTPMLESPGGLYVRADDFVFRLDPGDTAEVKLFATRYGRPYAGAEIVAAEDPSGLQNQVGTGDPSVDAPRRDVSFEAKLPPADAEGRATLAITASDPGNPRGYIDGQVYGVRPALADQAADYPTDPWNFVSLLVFDTFAPSDPITWWGNLQPVFQQYANLYPVMELFLDLSDYDSVCENRELLQLAFGLVGGDPNAMPVTRDLSRSKRAAILTWLGAPGPDGKPLLGTPPAAAAPADVAPDDGFELAAAPAGRAPGGPPAPGGSKVAAMARRRGFDAGAGR